MHRPLHYLLRERQGELTPGASHLGIWPLGEDRQQS